MLRKNFHCHKPNHGSGVWYTFVMTFRQWRGYECFTFKTTSNPFDCGVRLSVVNQIICQSAKLSGKVPNSKEYHIHNYDFEKKSYLTTFAKVKEGNKDASELKQDIIF